MDEKARRVDLLSVSRLVDAREVREKSALTRFQRSVGERDAAASLRDAKHRQFQETTDQRLRREDALYDGAKERPMTLRDLDKMRGEISRMTEQVHRAGENLRQAQGLVEERQKALDAAKADYLQRVRRTLKTRRTKDRVSKAQADWTETLSDMEADDMAIDRRPPPGVQDGIGGG